MMQIFWRALWRVRSMWKRRDGEPSADDHVCWGRDPLSHPSLAAMSVNDLADLPARQLRALCRD